MRKKQKLQLFLASIVVSLWIGAFLTIQEISNSKPTPTDLSQFVRSQFSEVLYPLENPDLYNLLGRTPNNSELELGRLLFNDPILSRNNDTSCATCHLANHGFADGNPLPAGSLGQGGPTGQTVGHRPYEGKLSLDRSLGNDGMGYYAQDFMFRNALSTLNVAFRADASRNSGLLWDGRFGDLEFQVLLPIHTPHELCGTNPVPMVEEQNNLFGAKGPFFKEPVTITHSHTYDYETGTDKGYHNHRPEIVSQIPIFRSTGSIAKPTRNECLALALAKLRSVPKYRQLFKQAFKTDKISDILLGKALASFVATHVANRTPFDSFAKGEETLTDSMLLGLAIFSTEAGKFVDFQDKKIPGAGCISCHKPPTFGGRGFASLGVRSDPRSLLSVPQNVFPIDSAFFVNPIDQRGNTPKCHIEGASVDLKANYAPDIGRAVVTRKSDDCFQFRVPPLRNVLDTFPYFHHGTGRIISTQKYSNMEEIAYESLKNVIRHHLRGPVSHKLYNRQHITQKFFDPYFQVDFFIPFLKQNFSAINHKVQDEVFPLLLSEEYLNALTDFVAYGLRDPDATKVGSMGNNVTHPKSVPSGFLPTITRDQGTQLETPPAADFKHNHR